jgi:ABC-type glutathione transport system ATPase component
VKRAFDKLEKDGDLVALPDGNYTTKKMLGSEMWALDQVRAQKGQTPKMMEPEAVAARIAQAEGRQGFKYSEGQKEAISKVLTTEDRYVAVQGLAGTGKTTMSKACAKWRRSRATRCAAWLRRGGQQGAGQETGIAIDTVSMFQTGSGSYRRTSSLPTVRTRLPAQGGSLDRG